MADPSRRAPARVALRAYEEHDAEAFVALMTDPSVTARTGGPMSAERAHALHAELARGELPPGGRLLAGRAAVDAASGAYLGHGVLVRSSDEPGAIEIGFWVEPSAEGRGVATAIARALAKEARALGPVIATVDSDHAASRRVLEKAGLVVLRTAEDAEGTFLVYALPPA